MTNREKLLDQYEDALFSLLMNEFAENEGKEALKENERLKEDITFVVPQELHQRCMKTITLYFAKRSIKKAGHVFGGVIKKIAVVALIGTLLFTTVFAVSSDFRIKTLNWVTEVFNDRTEFSFIEDEPVDKTDDDGQKVKVEWIPKGFYQKDQSENKFSLRLDYCSDNGEEFSVVVFEGANTTLGIDTEDAEVENIDIQGEEAILASKDGTIQIAWASQELQSYYIISGPETMKEDLIKVAQGIKISK